MLKLKQISLKQLLIFVVLPFVFGCKTKGILSNKQVPILTQAEVYDALLSHNNDFDWWTAKADADIESTSISGSGDLIIRIKKDSLVWLVGKKLGIEGVRIQATSTEYAAIFRLENTYQQGSLQKLEKTTGIPIVFEDLQNLMVGNIMIPTEAEIDSFNLKAQDYCLTTQIDNLDITYYINAFDLHLKKVKIVDRFKRVVIVQYSDYKKVESQDYPHRINITFDNQGDITKLELKLKDIEVNVPKNTPFSIPSHYDRVY